MGGTVGRVLGRFGTMLLALALAMSLAPMLPLGADVAFAATSGTVSGLADEGIGLSYDGDGDDAWEVISGTSVRGSVKVKPASGCGSATNYSSTLTITNKKEATATLSFSYAASRGGGTVTVDGDSSSENGICSKELESGESVKVYIESNGGATGITLSDVKLLVRATPAVTFQEPVGGTYTVDGQEVTGNVTLTKSSLEPYHLVANPAEGNQFVGWRDVARQVYLSTSQEADINFDAECIVEAVFASKEAALFRVNAAPFADLGEAVAHAQKNGANKITVEYSGAIEGSYTIPAGITLVVPMDEVGAVRTNEPEVMSSGSISTAKNCFATLRLKAGASLDVQGAVSIGGTYRSAAGSVSGYMTGGYGQIQLDEGSSLRVENGASLYAWGFVTGAGSVEIESGGTAYEWFQICDFRGGSATSKMEKESRVFPFNQYYVQNIEAPMTIHQGGKDVAYTGVYVSGSNWNATINFIGDEGLFKVASGSMTRRYDGGTDRITYTIDGESQLNNLALKLAMTSVNSKDYVLPVVSNMTVNVAGGGKLVVNQDAALLPGVQLNIAQGGEVDVAGGVNLYVYDEDQWDNYSNAGKQKSIAFAPSKTYTRTDADLCDAKVDISGKLVAQGSVYTTESGAELVSSQGSGIYEQAGSPGTEKNTYQYTQSGSSVTRHEISITPARLLNGDGTYTPTEEAAAGTSFAYTNDMWQEAKETFTVTWVNDDGTVLKKEQVESGTVPDYGGTPTKQGDAQYTYTFSGWDPEVSAATADVTYKATYTPTKNKYTVTWKDADGNVLWSDQVEYGEPPAYNGPTPTKQSDAGHSYAFAGWKAIASDGTQTDIVPVTGDVTYTAIFTATVNTYTVTWQNDNGTELQRDEDVPYGTMPAYRGATPVKAPTAQYTYVFNGWTPQVDKVSGDVTYTAVYDAIVNKYTVTWKDADGNVLKEEKVEYGTVPVYSGDVPTKANDECFSYTFSGWSPAIDETTKVVSDVAFTAQFEKESLYTYTVTFDANGGLGQMSPQSFLSGVAQQLSANAFAREGYRFTGWNTAADGTGEPYPSDGSIMPSSNMTLYAQWLFTDGWLTDDNGKTYYKDGSIAFHDSWQEIDGATYYFKTDGYVATGIFEVAPQGASEPARCVFNDDGEFQGSKTGVHTVGEDTYWLNSGIIEEYPGLKQVITNDQTLYYYFGEDGRAVKGGDYKVDKNNGLKLPTFCYHFLEDGVIEHDPDTTKNGICEGDGSLFYYIDGIKVGMGLIQIDGDYYYARTSTGEIVRGRTYGVSQTNGLLPAGEYRFASDGKMMLSGWMDDGGRSYYFINGVPAKGLTQIDDDWYLFNRASGVMYKDGTFWVHDNEGGSGLVGGMYSFDTSGKLVVSSSFVTETLKDGTLRTYYRYANGTFAKGLTQIDGDWYLFNRASGVMYKDGTFWVHDNEGGSDFKGGMYSFGIDGKMVSAS